MNLSVCVYMASSSAVAPEFFTAAERLGALLAERRDTLIFGGSRVGLMGAVARAVHEHGGRVVGVLPQVIHDLDIAYCEADELIVTQDIRERKAIMDRRADAFVALPGGFGTLEEMFEILTLKQLRLHTKPIAIVNTAHFYDPLIALFEHLYQQRFARPEHRQLYYVASTPEEVCDYLDTYRPSPPVSKLL